jgi:hypothetical protein
MPEPAEEHLIQCLGHRGVGPGPVLKLDSVSASASGEHCSWHTGFTIPDVRPRSYPLVSVVGTITKQQGEDAYALWVSSIMFEVTG